MEIEMGEIQGVKAAEIATATPKRIEAITTTGNNEKVEKLGILADISAIRRIKLEDCNEAVWGLLQRAMERLEKWTKGARSHASEETNLRSPPTWATIAAKDTPELTSKAQTKMEAPSRRVKEITIRIEDVEEKEGETWQAGQVLARIDKEATHKRYGELAATRRLPNGDLIFQASSVETREKLEERRRMGKGNRT